MWTRRASRSSFATWLTCASSLPWRFRGLDFQALPGPRRPLRPRRVIRWLAFFRIQGSVVGIVHGDFREGESFVVVKLDGAASRILAQLHGGGC